MKVREFLTHGRHHNGIHGVVKFTLGGTAYDWSFVDTDGNVVSDDNGLVDGGRDCLTGKPATITID